MSSQTAKAPAILIVDDDDLVLSSLRGLFTLETDYELIIQESPKQALEEVSRRPIDLVISDFLMPQMNGVDFLKRVSELQPDAVRILLTGFADKANAIRAINEVGLYQYLEKPWDNEDLLLLVRNALSEKTLRRQLKEKVDALERLIQKHAELSHRHQGLEHELDMAARVQRSLLPDEWPRLDGFCFSCYYKPSTALGGDYYDFAENGENFAVLLSDVSGHGVQAALISMLIRATFQELAPKAKGPTQLLRDMNVRLHRFLPTGMYAAAAVVWLAEGSSAVRITNAGLPYPFILRASADRVDQVPLGGLPLGIFDDTSPESYDSQERELARGDVLLLATDGLGEIRRPDERFFQDEHLAAALREITGKAGDQVIEELLRRARDFGNSDDYADDLSLVAITKT